MAKEKGAALIIILISLTILTTLGFMIVHMTSLNVRTSVEVRTGLERFYGAEGGILSVAGWMTHYKRFDIPEDVANPQNPASYQAEVRVLADSVRYQPGYSGLWRGSDVLINSRDATDRAEIEAVVFIPVVAAGYGNE